VKSSGVSRFISYVFEQAREYPKKQAIKGKNMALMWQKNWEKIVADGVGLGIRVETWRPA
jgi:hypothetical protein